MVICKLEKSKIGRLQKIVFQKGVRPWERGGEEIRMNESESDKKELEVMRVSAF